MNKINKKGFTLIELLTVIVVIGLIASIGVYAVNGLVKKAKEKSYQVTRNSVESQASSYLAENVGKLFFISNDDQTEYQCVTIQNLIDFGYLKNNIVGSSIADNRSVNKDDYVYLERNSLTKAITKAQYVYSSESVNDCNQAVEATSDIAISVNPASGWAKEKTVTITYKLKDVIGSDELSKYLYGYTFNGQSEENNETVKSFTAKENGELSANIKYSGTIIDSKDMSINGIDTTAPVISLGDYNPNIENDQAIVSIKVTDTESGVNTDSFTKDDLIVKVGNNELTSSNYTLTFKNNDTYELKVNNNTYEGKLIIIIDDNKVFDKVENGNLAVTLEPNINFSHTYTITYNANGGSNAPSAATYTYATSGTFALATGIPTRTGYTFLGWATSSTATTAEYAPGASYSKSNAFDVTLYAVWKINKVTIKYNANGGTMASEHGASYSLDSSGNVLTNGNVLKATINYGEQLGSSGLLNYNSTSYLNVVKTGYTVASSSVWNTSSNGSGTSYDQTTAYAASDFCDLSSDNCEVTLYVNWAAKQVKITYDANGGSNAPSATTYTYATSGTVALATGIPTRTGYTFLGWATSSTATTQQYNAGGAYNKNNPNNVTLYAVWSSDQIVVTLDGNGATTLGTSSVGVISGSSTIIPSNITLPKREYTITYDLNGTGATLPAGAAAKVAYTFNGWYDDVAGTNMIINNSSTPTFANSNVSGYIADGKWIGSDAKTLYANWTTGFVTLPYLTHVSYRCNWNTKADGSGSHYVMGKTNFTTNKDVILYAICEHVCCNSSITNSYYCNEYGGSDACYKYANTYINGERLGSNICETPIASCSGSFGWVDCSYTFTDCDTTTDDDPPGCTGSCPSGKHFDYNCNCVGDSGGGSGSQTPGGCFLAGTKVKTIYGYQDIEKIKVGDLVLSYNETTRTNEYKIVNNVLIHKNNKHDLYELAINGKMLKVTDVHRFYIRRNNEYLWVAAKDLLVGDMVKYADGTYHSIDEIKYSYQMNTVYNIEVMDNHNYYVSEDMILVHNEKRDIVCDLTGQCYIP